MTAKAAPKVTSEKQPPSEVIYKDPTHIKRYIIFDYLIKNDRFSGADGEIYIKYL
jgi:hypothetical protein